MTEMALVGEAAEPSSALHYRFHDLSRISLIGGQFPYLERKWSSWKTQEEGSDLRLMRGTSLPGEHRRVGAEHCYVPGMYRIRTGRSTFDVSSDSIACDGPFEEQGLEYGIVFPCINRTIVPKGAFLFYSAALSFNGRTVLIPSFQSSGKTSIVLELLGRGASYIADNDCILDRKGQCRMYSPMVGIHTHHMAAFPEIRANYCGPDGSMRGLRKRVAIMEFEGGLKGGNPLMLKVKDYLDAKSFCLCQIDIRRLYPGCEVLRSARLTHSFVLCPGSPSLRVRRSDSKEAAEMIAVRAWLRRLGERKVMSDLAGIPYFQLSDCTSVLEDGLSNTECFRLEYDGVKDRKGIVKLVDAMLKAME
ncbi:MAG: hypothetical protein MUE65_02270 [Methanomassiliicoccales archaeon]|nr:hypothetical protein [Methanomassiliicoccales archaeon]